MRRIALVFAACAALAGPCGAVEKGEAAPALELQTRDAQPLKLSLRGELVYLDFWASWCGPCKQSFPWMNEMHSRYGKQGLRVWAINVDQKPADAARFLAASPAQFDIGYDAAGASPRLFAVKTMPTSYLIDKSGTVLWKHAGFSPKDTAALEQAIQTALQGKP
ncbi:MAG: thiol:disulfide interchange protein [Burkholderiales bacterium PBB3]|nr:MAG: thiol:disulfide interchange protein [Burkholderiales bacterium PBB3]